jgi:hypothetical protein
VIRTLVHAVLMWTALGFTQAAAQKPSGPGPRYPEASAVVRLPRDSVLNRAIGVLRGDSYVLRSVDAAAGVIEGRTHESPPTELRIQLESLLDSTRVTIGAHPPQGTDPGEAMLTALSVLHDIARSKRSGGPTPSGSDWPTDTGGRVGFVLLTRAGAQLARARAQDTIPEVRPRDLPAKFRQDMEQHINGVGFDASCARFFKANSRYLVRFNKCSNSSDELDRLGVYELDGEWAGSVVGPTVGTKIAKMCPVQHHSSRSMDCPPPWH